MSLPGTGIISKSGTAAAPITFRSAGPTRSQLAGIFLVSGSNVVITDLDFVGVRTHADVNGIANYKNGMLTVNGSNVNISNNTISSPYGICIIVGNEANPVSGFRLEGNRIRGCGLLNTLAQQDSGSHGVYVSYATEAVITQNHI